MNLNVHEYELYIEIIKEMRTSNDGTIQLRKHLSNKKLNLKWKNCFVGWSFPSCQVACKQSSVVTVEEKKQSSINCTRHTFVRTGITSLNPWSN